MIVYIPHIDALLPFFKIEGSPCTYRITHRDDAFGPDGVQTTMMLIKSIIDLTVKVWSENDFLAPIDSLDWESHVIWAPCAGFLLTDTAVFVMILKAQWYIPTAPLDD